jgi:signal transduction histidine kinase
MRVHVVSSDEDLRKTCGLVLQPYLQDECGLTFSSSAEDLPEADFCLWDFDEMGFPTRVGAEQTQHWVFAVASKNLGLLQNQPGLPDVSILLKPASPQTLRPFLEYALGRCGRERAGGCDPVRGARDDLLQCLLQANLQLQEYDHSRMNFLARAVHDFRAPLTAVNGYCGLLLEQQVGPLNASQVDLLRRMHHSVKRIARMTTAISDLSVGCHVKKDPILETASIESCLDRAVHEIMPLADEKDIVVSVFGDPPGVELMFEPAKIEQVLINLLENACKYTPRHGSIELRGYPVFWGKRLPQESSPQPEKPGRTVAAHSLNAYQVDVRDSGAGIEPGCTDTIFEESTSYGGNKDRSGGGLGLAICRMIIFAHQGKIWAESSANGACFSFVLPAGDERARLGPAHEFKSVIADSTATSA